MVILTVDIQSKLSNTSMFYSLSFEADTKEDALQLYIELASGITWQSRIINYEIKEGF